MRTASSALRCVRTRATVLTRPSTLTLAPTSLLSISTPRLLPSSSSSSSSSPARSLASLSGARAAGRTGAATATAASGSSRSVALTTFPVTEAIALCRAGATARFDETIELAINLGVDGKKQNQQVRGVAKLPHGSGKQAKIAVFARGAKADEAKAAGADIVGDAELTALINEGKIDFTVCIATPDMMPAVGKVARILGPRGLMPNPKMGTVTMDVAAAVRNAKQGQVEFKSEKAGIVHAPVGKVSFTPEQIEANINALVRVVLDLKPATSKGTYIKRASISSTMGRGVPLDIRFPPFKLSQESLREKRATAVAGAAKATTSTSSAPAPPK